MTRPRAKVGAPGTAATPTGVVLLLVAQAGYPDPKALADDRLSRELATQLRDVLRVRKFDQDKLREAIRRSGEGLVLVAEQGPDDFSHDDLARMLVLAYEGQAELPDEGLHRYGVTLLKRAVLHDPKASSDIRNEVQVARLLHRAHRARSMAERDRQGRKQQDIRWEEAVLPEFDRAGLREAFRRFAESNPAEAGEAAEDHATIAAEFWQYEPRYAFTVEQAQEITDLSPSMLTKLARTRKGMAERRGKQWYFSGTKLAEYGRDSQGQPGRKPKSG